VLTVHGYRSNRRRYALIHLKKEDLSGLVLGCWPMIQRHLAFLLARQDREGDRLALAWNGVRGGL
jgi:hypothetical protein